MDPIYLLIKIVTSSEIQGFYQEETFDKIDFYLTEPYNDIVLTRWCMVPYVTACLQNAVMMGIATMRFLKSLFKKDREDDDSSAGKQQSSQPAESAPPSPPAAPSEPSPEPSQADDFASLLASESTEEQEVVSEEYENEPVEEPVESDENESFLDFSADDLVSDEEESQEEAELPTPDAPPADTVYISADEVLAHLPAEVLAATLDELNSTHGSNSDYRFSFNRSDLMYSLSRGKMEVSLSDLASKIALNVLSPQAVAGATENVILPLSLIVPKIPPEWLVRQDQDTSRETIVEEGENYFKDIAAVQEEEEEEFTEDAVAEEAAQKEETPSPVSQAEDAIPTQAYTPKAEEGSGFAPQFELGAAEEYDYEESPTMDLEPMAAAAFRGDEEPTLAQEGYGISSPEPEMEVEEELVEADLADEEAYEEPEGFSAPPPVEEPEFEEDEPVFAPPPAVEEPEMVADEEEEPMAPPPAVEEPEMVAEEISEPEPDEDIVEEELYEEESIADEEEPSQYEEPESEIIEDTQLSDLEDDEDDEDTDLDETQLIEPEAALEQLQDEYGMFDPEAVAESVFGKRPAVLGGQVKDRTASSEAPIESWRSQAPNGININRSGATNLCKLPGIGIHMAQLIIDHRKTHGEFSSLRDLLKISGLGRHTYRSMTGLSPRADLASAELQINELLDIDGKKVALAEICQNMVDQLKLKGVFLTGEDGLVFASHTTDPKLELLTDSLAGIAPQLWKRSKRCIAQGKLPEIDMFTFYVGRYPVTFAGSDEILIAAVHGSKYPNARELRSFRRILRELVWYCSFRAVV